MPRRTRSTFRPKQRRAAVLRVGNSDAANAAAVQQIALAQNVLHRQQPFQPRAANHLAEIRPRPSGAVFGIPPTRPPKCPECVRSVSCAESPGFSIGQKPRRGEGPNNHACWSATPRQVKIGFALLRVGGAHHAIFIVAGGLRIRKRNPARPNGDCLRDWESSECARQFSFETKAPNFSTECRLVFRL